MKHEYNVPGEPIITKIVNEILQVSLPGLIVAMGITYGVLILQFHVIKGSSMDIEKPASDLHCHKI